MTRRSKSTPRQLRFGIVAGSIARGSATNRSDIDYVRIGPARRIPPGLDSREQLRLSVTSYSPADFQRLLKAGSLFLHHLFEEGVLIEGDPAQWELQRRRFRVKARFPQEIRKYRESLRHIVRGGFTRASVIPFLSHSLTSLKNIAIFSLAERRMYVFEKEQAIQIFFPQFRERHLRALLDAEAVLDRSNRIQRQSDWRRFVSAADEIQKICDEFLAKK